MDRQIIVAREADQVMLIAFVVAHEYILAMHTPVIFPPPLGFLYRLAFGVVVRRERYAVRLQVP